MAIHIQLMVSIGYVNTLNFTDNVKFNDSFFFLPFGELIKLINCKTCEEKQWGAA